VQRAIQSFRPDLLTWNFVDENAYYISFAGFHPFVLRAAGSDLLQAGQPNCNPVERLQATFAAADFIICSGPEIRKRCIEFGVDPERTEVVPLGVDCNVFRPGLQTEDLRRDLEIGSRRVILSNRGDGKRALYNLPVIVRAFARAARRIDDAVLVMLVSRPQDAAPLVELAAKLGLADRFILRPWVPHDELPVWLNLADVCVSVPDSDGGPSSVWEAIACGTVTVVSDLPAVRDMVEHETNGLVVPSRDEAALADALERALGDSALAARAAEVSPQLACRRADEQRLADRMDRLYHRLIDEATAPRPARGVLREGVSQS
jgi:glycosyltransferase involved in cell wall biosynthesis